MYLETIQEPYLQLKPGSILIDYIVNNIKSLKDLPENILTIKKAYKSKGFDCLLTLSNIKWITEYLSQKEEKLHIHEILADSIIILPKPTVIPRNPQLDARVKKLQAEQDAREYKAMTKSVDSFRKHLPEDTIAYQSKYMFLIKHLNLSLNSELELYQLFL